MAILIKDFLKLFLKYKNIDFPIMECEWHIHIGHLVPYKMYHQTTKCMNNFFLDSKCSVHNIYAKQGYEQDKKDHTSSRTNVSDFYCNYCSTAVFHWRNKWSQFAFGI